ncbi:hypothetical protein ACU8JQ_000674 [Escherichia coli]
MGRKKKNNLKRIEKNSNFNSTRQRPPTHTNNEILGEEIIFILETESPELSDEELEIIQSMGDGVYFKPRTRKTTIIEPGTLKKWQLLNFTSYRHYIGFNSFNNQVGGVTETDLMQHLIDTLASNKRSN